MSGRWYNIRHPGRKTTVAAVFALIGFGVADHALSDGPYEGAAPPSSGYSNAHQMSGMIDDAGLPAPCRATTLLGPDYVPGVDVFGNRVVPAESDRSGRGDGIYPEPYFEVVRRMPRSPGVPRRAPVGEVVVDPATGQSYFNGMPLDGGEEAARDCAAALMGAGRR